MKTLAKILLIAALGSSACGPNGPSGETTTDEEEPIPDMPADLPCGGADLMTDNQNCGECGNECYVFYEGTEWEAGACVEGKCGPRWSPCKTHDPGETCDDICAHYGGTCVPAGCAGFGSLWIDVEWFSSECRPTVIEPAEAHVGCDIGFVPFEDGEVQRNGICCCEGI